MAAAVPAAERRELHHRFPRCLLRAWDRGHGPGLEPEDLAAWFEWEEEAYHYGVSPDVSREDLAALIEGSTVELPGDEHRAGHSAAGDFARWGRLGGLETLRRYGRPWFVLLAKRRWKKVAGEQLAEYRAEQLAAKVEAAWWPPRFSLWGASSPRLTRLARSWRPGRTPPSCWTATAPATGARSRPRTPRRTGLRWRTAPGS